MSRNQQRLSSFRQRHPGNFGAMYSILGQLRFHKSYGKPRRDTGEFVSTLSQKKRPNFETVSLESVRIDFDDIWQKY